MRRVAGAPTYDVLTIGRVGVDIYPLQTRIGLEDVETFGIPGRQRDEHHGRRNRHSHSSAVITRTGADPFGRCAPGPA